MTLWVRCSEAGEARLGQLEGDTIVEYSGDLFDAPRPTGRRLSRGDAPLLAPCQPGKVVALWNNFHALADKLGKPVPRAPLYFLKATTSVIAAGQAIERPPGYAGKIVFEGELGIVIGRVCRRADAAEARAAIFGFTCVNDVTAVDILDADPTFAQWCRAKSFDTFCCLGPAIATAFDWRGARVRTRVAGEVRQDYPIADMVFDPETLVSLISADMTLMPGDVIACGTSIGVGSIKPGVTVEVDIEGIGVLANTLRG